MWSTTQGQSEINEWIVRKQWNEKILAYYSISSKHINRLYRREKFRKHLRSAGDGRRQDDQTEKQQTIRKKRKKMNWENVYCEWQANASQTFFPIYPPTPQEQDHIHIPLE